MLRQLNSAGTWFKRNGLSGLDNLYRWFINGVTQLTDTFGIGVSPTSFGYTPSGTAPVGSQTDTFGIATSPAVFSYKPPVQPQDSITIGIAYTFSYTPDGTAPVGSQTDSISIGITPSFSYA